MATGRLLEGSPMVLRAGWSKGLGPVQGLCRDLRQRFAVIPLPTGTKGDDFRHRLDAIIDPDLARPASRH